MKHRRRRRVRETTQLVQSMCPKHLVRLDSSRYNIPLSRAHLLSCAFYKTWIYMPQYARTQLLKLCAKTLNKAEDSTAKFSRRILHLIPFFTVQRISANCFSFYIIFYSRHRKPDRFLANQINQTNRTERENLLTGSFT